MFDVSWVDPERETVGERRSRKGQGRGSACASRDGPSLPSQASPRSSPRKASKSGRPTTSNVFGPSTLYTKRGALSGGRQSRYPQPFVWTAQSRGIPAPQAQIPRSKRHQEHQRQRRGLQRRISFRTLTNLIVSTPDCQVHQKV